MVLFIIHCCLLIFILLYIINVYLSLFFPFSWVPRFHSIHDKMTVFFPDFEQYRATHDAM
jgi:hypothetical protein